MANVTKKPKQKPHKLTTEELTERDALASGAGRFMRLTTKQLRPVRATLVAKAL